MISTVLVLVAFAIISVISSNWTIRDIKRSGSKNIQRDMLIHLAILGVVYLVGIFVGISI